MSWPQQEKAIIIALAYTIGFVTAFIAYGVVGENQIKDDRTVYQLQESYTAKAHSQETSQAGVSITLDEQGLYVHTPKGSQLLSANRAPLLSANAIDANNRSAGIHYAIIDAELSRDNKYVYFCEQLVASATSCDPYIYNIAAEVLIPVTVNDEKYYPVISDHLSSWTKGELLTLNDYISMNGQSPWKLVTR